MSLASSILWLVGRVLCGLVGHTVEHCSSKGTSVLFKYIVINNKIQVEFLLVHVCMIINDQADGHY